MSERTRKLIKYVVPTMLGSISFFLFTIVDGIFVGRGVGTNALGAVNLVMPFVMVVNALFQLTTIGGVAIIAVRLGRGDAEGANHGRCTARATARRTSVRCATTSARAASSTSWAASSSTAR